MKRILLGALCVMVLPLAQAITIDFGTQWDKSNLPSQVLGFEGGTFSDKGDIAGLLNSKAGTSFSASEIFKTDKPAEVDDQFAVPEGWNYLVVQYDGPNGGSVVIQLGGAGALVPYESYDIWGGNSEQYKVSHYAVAGAVPDAGTTAALLGLGLLGVGFLGRRKA